MAVTRAFTTSQLDSRVDFYYTATSGQTTFSGSDDNGSTLSYTASGKKDVYLNGTLLIESDDYVATNGTSVVLQATTQAGDIVHISVNKVMSNLVNLVDTAVDLNGNELILDADGDTSITADTDDQIDFKTGGTDRMHIDSSGRVGIGTSSPDQNLHVSDTSTNAYIKIISNDSNTAGILFGDQNAGLQGKLYYLNGSDAMRFDTNGSERMRINSSGNVGIGTTSPSQKLDVNGTINATAFTGDGSALTGISASDIAAASIGTSNNSNGYIRFTNNLLINWVRKSSTGTQTINWPLAFTNFYGCYTAGESTSNGHLRIHSAGVGSVTVSNANQNITGWVLAFGRKT